MNYQFRIKNEDSYSLFKTKTVIYSYCRQIDVMQMFYKKLTIFRL